MIMYNYATVTPGHSIFTVELLSRCNKGPTEVKLRNGTTVRVVHVNIKYESHGDWYDLSHFEMDRDKHSVHTSWDMNGFNTYPKDHNLDIVSM